MSSDSIVYCTGCTSEGVLLMGGIWTLWHQNGFPLEMSYLVCRDGGWVIDWLEAMADASVTNDLPALVGHIETFLPSETMTALKTGFMSTLGMGKTYAQIVAEKRANGQAFEDLICTAFSTILCPPPTPPQTVSP